MLGGMCKRRKRVESEAADQNGEKMSMYIQYQVSVFSQNLAFVVMRPVSYEYNFKKIRTIKLLCISYFLLEFKGNYIFLYYFEN